MFSWAVAIIHTLRDLKIVSPRSVLAIRPSRHHFLTAPFGCVYSIRLRGQVRAGPENKVRPKQHRCMLVSHESSPEGELVRLWLVWGKSLKHARWLMTLVLPNLFLAQWFVAVAWCIAGIEVNFYSFDELQGAEMYLGMGGEGLLFGPWRNTISLENRFANGFLNGFFIGESTRRWMSSGKCVGSANFFGTTSTVLPAFTYILPLTIRVHNSIPTLKPSEVLRCQRCTESAAFAMPKAVLTRWRDFCGGKSFERKSSAVPTGRRCAKIESSLISSCCNWHHVGTNRFLYDICQDWFWRLLDLPFKRTPNTFDLRLGRSHCLIQKLPRDTPEGSKYVKWTSIISSFETAVFLLWSKCSGQPTQPTGHTFSLHPSNIVKLPWAIHRFNAMLAVLLSFAVLSEAKLKVWPSESHMAQKWCHWSFPKVSSSNPERICFDFPFVLDGRDGFGPFSIPKAFLKVSSHEMKEHCNWGEQIWVEANLTWLDVELQQACRLRTQHFFTPCLPLLGFFLIHAVGGIQNGEIAVLLTSPWKIEVNQLLNWSTCFGTLPQAPEDDCSYCFPSADATEEVRWKVKSIQVCVFFSKS